MTSTTDLKSIFQLFLPDGTFDWFDVIEGSKDESQVHIILEEKNIPPISKEELSGKKIISKGFTDITINDFPIRGRKTLLTFRRRYWQIEGQKELLKRDIKICFPGTQLEKEFADFLKEDGRDTSSIADFYRRVSENPGQRI